MQFLVMIRDQLLSIPMKKYLILMDFFTDHSLSERKRFVLRSLRAKETHQTLNFKTTTSEGKTKHKKRTIRHGKRFKNNFQTKILASDF